MKRVGNPEITAREALAGEFDPLLKAEVVRKALERSRTKFGDLFLEQVIDTLEELHVDLKQRGFLWFCKAMPDRRMKVE